MLQTANVWSFSTEYVEIISGFNCEVAYHKSTSCHQNLTAQCAVDAGEEQDTHKAFQTHFSASRLTVKPKMIHIPAEILRFKIIFNFINTFLLTGSNINALQPPSWSPCFS
ncbi:hypothetical protein ILYODFUR_008781 [Ilyodon furcidens]|uniref:Uncharacterized protein n=1 Tax=Ilyodon furcidens TaxID=33524 RepID=A0ABV0T6F3_9TELE